MTGGAADGTRAAPSRRPSKGAGRRRRGRELALRVLFEVDGTGHGPDEALRYQAEELRVAEDVEAFARRLVTGCLEHLEEIDERIAAASAWRVGDLGKVERAVLRLGTWELLFSAETPPAVSINESVELARAYAGEEARSYVNGVLGSIAPGRGGRVRELFPDSSDIR